MKYVFGAFVVLVLAGLVSLVIWGASSDAASEDRCHQAGGHWVKSKGHHECWVGHKIKV